MLASLVTAIYSDVISMTAGIYTKPTLNATTKIALVTYRESFFINNPLLNRNNDYEGSPYFEFLG